MFDVMALYRTPAPFSPVAGRCALRQCGEQFNQSQGVSLDSSGVSGNMIAVGNRGMCAALFLCSPLAFL